MPNILHMGHIFSLDTLRSQQLEAEQGWMCLKSWYGRKNTEQRWRPFCLCVACSGCSQVNWRPVLCVCVSTMWRPHGDLVHQAGCIFAVWVVSRTTAPPSGEWHIWLCREDCCMGRFSLVCMRVFVFTPMFDLRWWQRYNSYHTEWRMISFRHQSSGLLSCVKAIVMNRVCVHVCLCVFAQGCVCVC